MAWHFVSPKKQIYFHARTFVKDNIYGRIMAEFINHLSNMKEYHHQLPFQAFADKIYEVIENHLSTQQLNKLIQRTATSIQIFESCDGINNKRHANFLFI